jgi:hypothetical protein
MVIAGGTPMLDSRVCDVNTAAELDAEIRDIFELDQRGRGDEICGTLYVDYTDESVKRAVLVSLLERRGVKVQWCKRPFHPRRHSTN